MTLEIVIDDDPRCPAECAGCDRKMTGERFLTGIESCCGTGCVRNLCQSCVEKAAVAFRTEKTGAFV